MGTCASVPSAPEAPVLPKLRCSTPATISDSPEPPLPPLLSRETTPSLESINVFVRIRPCNGGGIGYTLNSEEATITLPVLEAHQSVSPKQPLTFSAYNRIFGEEATNAQVYLQSLKKCIHRALEGENVTVMAYGQTGSGKTHTMVGSRSNPGILPLGIQDLFRLANESENDVKITMTVLEIYGEEVHDLCADDTSSPVRVVEIDGVTTPVGVTVTPVTSSEQARDLQQRAVDRRVVEATKMNAHSSRSHVVVTFHVSSTTRESHPTTSLASLTFVDLAGSERLAKTGLSYSAKAGKQGVQINMGLLCLSKVIKAVANDPGGHAPFRDSKLTRILKPSFGGNAVTLFLANITPAPEHYAETVSTLRYSCLAAGVVNSVVKNEDETTRMRRELADLRRVGKLLTKEAKAGGKYVHITREEVERVERELE